MVPFFPAAAFTAGLAGLRMMSEAQTVVAFRLCGMAGLLPVSRSENGRMFSEKAPALLEANSAAAAAMMKGGRPDEIYSAWVKPIGRKTRANAKRLSRLAST